MIFIRDIEEAKHIVLIATTNPDSLCSASAFYSYLMKLHKKVTFYIDVKELPQNLSFIPWFDKIKNTFPTSADFAVSFGVPETTKEIMACDKSLNIDNSLENSNYGDFNLVDLDSISISQVVFDFFNSQDITINQKMATSLYGGLIDGSRGFSVVNGTSFAFASKMIECGAEHSKSMACIKSFHTLAELRLKSIIFSKMLLKGDGRFACLSICEDDFRASGAKEEDALKALEEILYLPTVSHVVMVAPHIEGRLSLTVVKRDSTKALLKRKEIVEYRDIDTLIEEIILKEKFEK